MRYGRNENSQPYGADAQTTFDNWGDSTNSFNSINVNHNWVLGGSKLNEIVFQYADFSNQILSRSSAPNETFPNNVTTGANGNTPQTTQQKKWQFRDDFSWHVTGMGGLGHDFKTGVNFVNEPRLFITFNTGKGAVFNSHLTNDVHGPISDVTLSDGDASANIPMKQFATYVQDDWRVSDRLTLNLGLRWDLMTGYQFDESKNRNYVAVVEAAKAGLLTGIKGLENMALSPQEDHNNFQPRIGGVFDLSGTGSDVIRAGWGIYTDVGYTNSNGLFAAADSSGKGFGQVFSVSDPAGIRNPDGSFYQAGQPLANIASQNQVVATGEFPLFGQWVDPRLRAAVHTADERRLVARADVEHGDHRRLRARGRPRPRPPSAREPAAHGHDHPPARRPRAVARPEHCRHQADHQPGQEPVRRVRSCRRAAACRTAWTSAPRTRCRRAGAQSATPPTS